MAEHANLKCPHARGPIIRLSCLNRHDLGLQNQPLDAQLVTTQLSIMKTLFLFLALFVQDLKASGPDEIVAEPRAETCLAQKYTPYTQAFLKMSDLLANIFRCIGNDNEVFADLLPVSKDFVAAFDQLAMTEKLAKIGYPLLSHDSKREIALHYWLRAFTQGRLSDVFEIGSVIQLESPQMVEHAAKFVLGNPYKCNGVKFNYFRDLGEHLVNNHYFSALSRMFQIIPLEFRPHLDLSNVNIQCFLYTQARQIPDTVFGWMLGNPWKELFMRALAYIIAAPVSDGVIMHYIDKLGKTEWDISNLCQAIIDSLLLDFVKYTPEERDMIYARNLRLLSKCNELNNFKFYKSKFAVAKLINSARLSTIDDDELIETAKSVEHAFLQDQLLAAAVYSNRRDFFCKVWSCRQPSTEVLHDSLIQALKLHPSFVKHMPLTKSSHDIVKDLTVLKHVIQYDMQELDAGAMWRIISNMQDKTLRLAAAAFTQNSKVFKKATYMFASCFDYYQAKELAIDELDNPVSFINFLACDRTLPLIGKEAFGHEKYLRALLREATKDEREIAIEKLKELPVTVSVSFVHSLLTDTALASDVGSESNRHVLGCFRIPWHDLFAKHSLSLRQLLHIFQVLQMPIADLSFSTPITFDSMERFSDLLQGPLSEIAKHTNECGFLPHLIMYISLKDVISIKPFRTSAEFGAPNPFLLRSFYLFAWWHHSNHENFVAFAPPVVVRAFMPKTLPQIPNPFLPESVHLARQLLDDVSWQDAPQQALRVLEECLHPDAADVRPLRNFDPFEKWKRHALESFQTSAPLQAKKAFGPLSWCKTLSRALDELFDQSAPVQHLLMMAYLENQELFVSFSTLEDMIEFYKKYLSRADANSVLRSLNCRIHLTLSVLSSGGRSYPSSESENSQTEAQHTT